MVAIGKLLRHQNFHLRMVSVHHAWALRHLKRRDHISAAMHFNAARERLHEAIEEIK